MTQLAEAPTDAGQEAAPVATEQPQATAAPAEVGQAEVKESDSASFWFDSADDETKGYIQNKGWVDDPLKAVKSYQELERFRGADETQLLKLPKNLDEEGALDAVYDRLGRPKDPSEYKVESLPDGVSVDENRLNVYSQAAHQLGLSQKQFDALAKLDAEYQQQQMTNYLQEREKVQQAEYESLLKEWGPNASEREELARRGLNKVLPDGADKAALANAIEDAVGTANMLKMFANLGDLGREDSIHDSGDARPFGYTREQAAADKAALMRELQGDKKRLDNYNKNIGPDVEKMRRLNEIIAG